MLSAEIVINFLAVTLFIPSLASANDGIGSVGIGGIVFRHTDAIAMKKEVLNVGHDLISVDYEFANESAADVEEAIVFPLPVYATVVQAGNAYYGQPDGFSITVDGKPVPFRTVVRALFRGADITARLRKLGLDDAQIAFSPAFRLETPITPLDPRQRRKLTKLGWIAEGPFGAVGPVWDVQVNYVWRQKFPAHRIVRVHHAYRPFVGAGPGESGLDDATAKRYCADAAFLKNREALAKRGELGERLDPPAAKVSYILKTGNTWKRGIEDFTLNIVKSAPTEIVSLCFPGVFRKIDALTDGVHLPDFRPKHDLEIYFSNVEPGGDDGGRMPTLNR